MNHQIIIQAVQEKIQQAKIGDGLERLIDYLGKDLKYNELHNEAIRLKSLHAKTKQDESKGIVSFDNAQLNYNRVNDGLLALLDDLEAGRLTISTPPPSTTTTSIPWKWIIGILLIAIIGIAIFFFTRNTAPIEQPVDACPSFVDQSEFNILVFPFDNLGGGSFFPHKQIFKLLDNKITVDELSDKACVRVYEKLEEMSGAFSTSVAQQKGKKCKAQLVIWGTAEVSGIQKIISARYRLIDKDKLNLTKLTLDEDANLIDTVETVTSISGGGTLVHDIEQIIDLFFGIVNHELGRHIAAIENLEKITPKDSSERMLINTVLADSYIATKNTKKAIETYEKVLDQHPNYQLANVNQGILLFQQERFDEAIVNLSSALKNDPDNTIILKARAESYIKVDQLKKAKEDYKELKSKSPSNVYINERYRFIEKEIQVRDNDRIRAERQLRRSPNNVSALTQTAKASQSVGNTRQAKSAAQKLIQQDRSNPLGYQILTNAYLEAGDTLNARRTINKAIQSGIKKDKVIKNRRLSN